MNYNKLTVMIYEQNSTTLVKDPLNELERVQDIKKDTRFPYGLYGSASFKLKRNVTDPWPWRGGHRVAIYNGLNVVYEGVLASVNIYNEEAEQGLIFTAYGAWGQILEKWTINKRWADNRLGEDAWRVDTSATNTARELVGVDREGRLRFSPTNNTFTTSHLASLYYNMPTGQTIKRVALSYDFSERYTTQPKAAKIATPYGYETAYSVKHGVYYGFNKASKVFSRSGATYTDRPNTYDGSTGTSETFTLGAGDSLWVRRTSVQFKKIKFNLGATLNTNVRTITSVKISIGGVLTAVTGLVDGTSTGGKTMAQDGNVTWDENENWEETTINGYRGFWVRIDFSGALTAVNFVEIECEDLEARNFTTLTNAFDGSTGTNVTATIADGDNLFIGYNIPFASVRLNLGATLNTTVTALSVYYWEGDEVDDGGIEPPHWDPLVISDGTSTGGKPLAQDGVISWTPDSDWIKNTVNGVNLYWIKITIPTGVSLTAVNFVEIECQNDDVRTFTDLPAAIDGDTSTSESLTLTTVDYLYIKGEPLNWGFVSFDFGTMVNNQSSALVAEYYQAEQVASTGLIPAAWASLSITDGTDNAGATFTQDGDVVFMLPDDAQEITIDGERGVWLRFSVTNDLDPAITVKEIHNGITQAWELRLRDRTGAANIWSVTSTATGSRDDTLGTPRQRLDLEYLSKAKQIAESNGTLYGQVTVPIVYGMTGSINVATIASDIISTVTDLNSSTVYLTTPGSPLSLVPFFTVGSENAGNILARAAAYGDTSFAQWFFQLLASDLAPTPDGKPVLKLAQFPDITTGFDYRININAETLKSLSVVIDYDNVANYIKVAYTDSEGIQQEIGPADDALLMSDDSINIKGYGRRELASVPNIGEATSTTALNYGKRILATRKDPRVIVSQAIPIVGFILDKYGQPVPASEIEAGKRLRIDNYLDDIIGKNGAGFTAIISDVSYDDATETAMIGFGVWDDLAVLLAQRSLLNDENFNF